MQKRCAKRTVIPEDWKPSADDVLFAESLGVPIEIEGEKFRDHHLAVGNLLASIPAAWRNWCRNAVRMGHATGQRIMPLFSVVAPSPTDPGDSFGAAAWAAILPNVGSDVFGGVRHPALGGYNLAETARDACAAAGFPTTWRGDLNPVADWLRAGIDPDQIVSAIQSCSARPNTPTLRYYSTRVMGCTERRRA
jgi:hypothetical protein